MARLSFIEQERIARNMTDADILGEYEQKGSVLPPGITMDQSVLLGEMEGRTYVRDATSAAETAANMQPGSTADQQVEKFKGGMQGVQQLLAMGPQQGMPPEGMPQQMGPQQMGPQMAADGGVIGYQTGGQYGRVIDDPESIGSQASRMGMSRQDFEKFLQGGLPQEKSGIPYISGVTDALFGARTVGEALDDPMRVLRTTGVNLGLAALTAGTGGATAPLFAARFGAVRGIPALARGLYAPTGGLLTKAAPGGQQLLRLSASDSMLRRALARGLGGGGYRQFLASPAGQSALANLGSGRMISGAAQTALNRARMRAMATAGGAALLPGTIGASAIISALQSDPTLTQEQIDEAMAAFEAQQAAGADDPGGVRGMGSALEGDIGRIYTKQMDDLARHQDWLREATPEERALEGMFSSRSDDMLSRIDRGRDRNELLYMMAGGAARAIEQGGTGGSSVEALIDLSDEVRRRGREQRTERQGLEDLAFNLRALPLERAAGRSRQTTMDARNTAMENLRQQIVSARLQEMQNQGTLAAYQQRNQLGIGDLDKLRTALQMLGGDNMSPEQIEEAMASAIGIASAPYGIAGLNQ